MGVRNRVSGSMTRVRDRQRRRSEERLAERLAQQWAEVRAERRAEDEAAPDIDAGPTNFSRAQVPWAVDLAAAWSWRFLVIAAAAFVVAWLLARFAVVFLPLAIALLLAALAVPLVELLHRRGLHRRLSAAVVLVGGLAVVGLLLTFVGTQVSQGASDLAQQVVNGLEQVRQWLQTGPLHATDSQINDFIKSAQDAVTSSNEELLTRASRLTTTLGHVVAGFFIVLFGFFFFLADGSRIWAWVVRLFPRAARTRVDSSGKVAWTSLTQFVRATVLVALVDAVGVMIVALILRVPFAVAIGVLVFLGSFIPMIGATLSGTVAVLVALVSHGGFVALLMLAGVILVQQIEAHVLQPFLLGRFVSLHPLGVIVAIACGVLVAGIAGALIAVPLVAALNAVVHHLSGHGDPASEPAVEGTTGPG